MHKARKSLNRTIIAASIFAVWASISSSTLADDGEHFASLPSPDIQSAKCNLQAYNEKLAAIVSKKKLTPLDMVKVHELTYTLENALETLKNEITAAAVSLEEVHKASETMGESVVLSANKNYLDKTTMLLAPLDCAKKKG